MMRYCYIVTEGPQDVEFLIRLLKFQHLKRVTKYSSLDEFWKTLIPSSFPINNDLIQRVPIPMFLQNNELSVAVHCAKGISRLALTIQESLAILEISKSKIFGVGLILDADTKQTPNQRFDELNRELTELKLSLVLPQKLGEVTNQSPRFGVFIMPDNIQSGTLEDILLKCAEVNYPDLLNLATQYINNIDKEKLKKEDLEELNKTAGNKKAIVSTISSILKPGKTLQVSIQDNRWIDEQTRTLDCVNLVKDFIDEITGFNHKL